MSIIVFMKDNDHIGGIIVSERIVSADIVGTMRDGVFHVDQSDSWLFDWEKADPKCYARKMQARGSFPLKL